MKNNFKFFIKKAPIISNIILLIYRMKIACQYFIHPAKMIFVWLLDSNETTNLTYDLTRTNKEYLITLISHITGKEYSEIETYFYELENNQDLRKHIHNITHKSDEKCFADAEAKYGRRIGWYALVRAIKPEIIVETGIDKGLGSCVLTAALMMNEREGYPGYYYGTDINPKAGFLLCEEYRKYGEILYGDSIDSLKNFHDKIDLFINDSDHSSEYEEKEYQTIVNKLSSKAIIIGDNAHCTDKLLRFSLLTNRQFLFFQEKPDKHWYPGGGIGIAFNKRH